MKKFVFRNLSILLIVILGIQTLCFAQEKKHPGAGKKRAVDVVWTNDGKTGDDQPNVLRYKKRGALVIGISSYKKLSDLTGTSFDATEVASILEQRYGFEDVRLLLDRKPLYALSKKIEVIVSPEITKKVIVQELEKLRKISKEDALFFFYAGHGMKGYLVTADAVLGKKNTMLSWREIVKRLRQCDAHHTLMVLDCCFSGSILNDSKIRQEVGFLGRRSLKRESDNFSRVFNRRSFQIITAGAGEETVGDQITISSKYAEMKKYQNHSPFTAVFLQALRGLTGRADGRQLASDLGYYMNYTLVNDLQMDARQAPRYALIGGEGDFVFFPVGKVLNPKLLSPLYQSGEEYSRLRASACRALKKFILQKKHSFSERVKLTRSVLPHISKLLYEKDSLPKLAAMEILSNLGTLYGGDISEFGIVIKPLVKILREADKNQKRASARCLGSLPLYANREALQSIRIYLHTLKESWQNFVRGKSIPISIQDKTKCLSNLDIISGKLEEQMRYLEKRRKVLEWLHSNGRLVVERHQSELRRGKSLLFKGHELSYNMRWREAESKYIEAYHCLKKLGENSLAANWGMWNGHRHSPPSLNTYQGHKNFLWKVKFSPCGRFALSASEDKSVRVWQIQTGCEIFCFRGHEKAVLDIDVFGKFAISVGEDKRLLLWEIYTGKKIREFICEDVVRSIAFSPNGKLILTGNVRGILKLLSVNTGKILHSWKGHNREIFSVAFSPDGRFVASGSGDKKIRVWQTKKLKQYCECQGHNDYVLSVAFSPDGHRLVSASSDLQLKLWDVDKGKEIRTFIGHSGAVMSAIFSPDGHFLLSGGFDGFLKLWSIKGGKCITTFTGHNKAVSTVAFSSDGNLALSGSFDGLVKLWKLKENILSNWA